MAHSRGRRRSGLTVVAAMSFNRVGVFGEKVNICL